MACGAAELLDGSEAGVIDADAEGNAEVQQHGDQPARRVAAIEHQQIVLAQGPEVFEQHLPLGDGREIQLKVQCQLEAGQVAHKRDGFADLAARWHP